MIQGNDLPHSAGLAVVEEDEILHHVEQSFVRQHSVEQNFRLDAAFFLLVVAFPFGEMLPSARDRTVTGAMPVADDEEGIVMKGVGDNMLVHVIPQVAVES